MLFEVEDELDVRVPARADEGHVGVPRIVIGAAEQLEPELLRIEVDRLVHVVDEDRSVQVARHAVGYDLLAALSREDSRTTAAAGDQDAHTDKQAGHDEAAPRTLLPRRAGAVCGNAADRASRRSAAGDVWDEPGGQR